MGPCPSHSKHLKSGKAAFVCKAPNQLFISSLLYMNLYPRITRYLQKASCIKKRGKKKSKQKNEAELEEMGNLGKKDEF